MALTRISLELTNLCRKGCAFCYNASDPRGGTTWTDDEIVALAEDCARHGVTAISFGGGEPLEYPGLFNLLTRLRGTLARTLTTHGLLLDPATIDRLVAVAPEKIHLSIHQPARLPEVHRVLASVHELAARGIPSGINLLVARSQLPAAITAASILRDAGIDAARIVYLPMRGRDTPTPDELATVAGGPRFQSMTCLLRCAASPRFCSIGWDRGVAWCSYTRTRNPLRAPTHAALLATLENLGLTYCGEPDALPRPRLTVLA